MHVVQHQPFYPFTMFWPTDDVFNSLPEDRKKWLYSEDHRDKLQAYLKAHIVRDQRVRDSDISQIDWTEIDYVIYQSTMVLPSDSIRTVTKRFWMSVSR